MMKFQTKPWTRLCLKSYKIFYNCGIQRMKGFLLGQGVRVQWSRVRSSLLRTDPSGILL